MALIICTECKKQISEYADKCPNCGCPMSKIKEDTEKINDNLPEKIECPACGNIKNISEIRSNNYKCILCGTDVRISKDDLIKEARKNAADKTCNELSQSQQQNIPKCPTCGSTNIQKISGTERAMSVIGLGIMSKKIGKSFKCNHCKYTW